MRLSQEIVGAGPSASFKGHQFKLLFDKQPRCSGEFAQGSERTAWLRDLLSPGQDAIAHVEHKRTNSLYGNIMETSSQVTATAVTGCVWKMLTKPQQNLMGRRPRPSEKATNSDRCTSEVCPGPKENQRRPFVRLIPTSSKSATGKSVVASGVVQRIFAMDWMCFSFTVSFMYMNVHAERNFDKSISTCLPASTWNRPGLSARNGKRHVLTAGLPDASFKQFLRGAYAVLRP